MHDDLGSIFYHAQLDNGADAKRIVFSLLDLEKLIITAVNGHAMGLGATIALLCDTIFMSSQAKIADPHVRIGVVAGDGGCVIWPQLIGYAKAKAVSDDRQSHRHGEC